MGDFNKMKHTFDWKTSTDIQELKKFIDNMLHEQKFYDTAILEFVKAGGNITRERLENMSMKEFANICGRNHLVLIYKRDENV